MEKMKKKKKMNKMKEKKKMNKMKENKKEKIEVVFGLVVLFLF